MKVKEKSEKADLKLSIQKAKIMASGPITSWQIDEETVETVADFFFFWAPRSLQMVIAAMKLKDTPWKESYDQPRQHFKKPRHYSVNKGLSSQSYGFSSSHICMWELDHKETWALKNWCFWTVVLEKTLESPLDCKEIQPVHPKGNKLQYFGHLMGRTDSLEKTLRKDWRRMEKGTTEDEMVGWHPWLNGHEFE